MTEYVPHPLYARAVQQLARAGGLYTFQDIMERVADGRFQSHAFGESWAVTQIAEYPRKRALNIVFVVGHLEELNLMEADLTGFAREQGCDVILADGRVGWEGKMLPGWKVMSTTYIKDLSDGS